MVVIGIVATDVVVVRHGHDRSIAWWTCLPLLLPGLGSGVVVSPNLTLTGAEVPIPQAGAASGVIQTGQRLGTAAGITLIGAVFFGALATSRGDYVVAVSRGLRVTLALIVLALVAGIVDVFTSSRRPG